MFGLSEKHIEAIHQCFRKYPGIEIVVVYGSRAKGNYRKGSDIDLAIQGNLSFSQLLQLENELDDLLLPYKIDLSNLTDIGNPDLIAHIERIGKVFYDKSAPLVMNEPPVAFKKQPSE